MVQAITNWIQQPLYNFLLLQGGRYFEFGASLFQIRVFATHGRAEREAAEEEKRAAATSGFITIGGGASGGKLSVHTMNALRDGVSTIGAPTATGLASAKTKTKTHTFFNHKTLNKSLVGAPPILMIRPMHTITHSTPTHTGGGASGGGATTPSHANTFHSATDSSPTPGGAIQTGGQISPGGVSSAVPMSMEQHQHSRLLRVATGGGAGGTVGSGSNHPTIPTSGSTTSRPTSRGYTPLLTPTAVNPMVASPSAAGGGAGSGGSGGPLAGAPFSRFATGGGVGSTVVLASPTSAVATDMFSRDVAMETDSPPLPTASAFVASTAPRGSKARKSKSNAAALAEAAISETEGSPASGAAPNTETVEPIELPPIDGKTW